MKRVHARLQKQKPKISLEILPFPASICLLVFDLQLVYIHLFVYLSAPLMTSVSMQLYVSLLYCPSVSLSLFDWMHETETAYQNPNFLTDRVTGNKSREERELKRQSRRHKKTCWISTLLEEKKKIRGDRWRYGGDINESVVKVMFLLSNLSLSLTSEL